MAFRIMVQLTKQDAEKLSKPVNGQGGFQNLMRGLQKRLRGRQVWVTQEEIVRIYRYATRGGQGGFQGRLMPFLDTIRDMADTWVTIHTE
jgi:hypothetical protein